MQRVQEERGLIKSILARKKNWIGHAVRHDSMMKLMIEGRMEGKRGRGRMRMGMIDVLLEDGTYVQMKRRAEDRDKWKRWMPRTCS